MKLSDNYIRNFKEFNFIKTKKNFENLFNKKYLIIFLLFGIYIVYYKYLWALLTPWREDEAVTLWLALENNLTNIPFGNVSSKGVPNPNLSVIISKFLILFDSLIIASLALSIIQCLLAFYLLKIDSKNFNQFLIILVSTSVFLSYVNSTIWYQFLISTTNVLFLKLIFDYYFKNKYYLSNYFPVVTILPASIYLGGLSNSVLYALYFLIAISTNLKNLKLHFENKKHLFSSLFLFLFLLSFTWYQYFSNLSISNLKIQNDFQLFPYSRVRDYVYVGYQYVLEIPEFLFNIFSNTETIYFLYVSSDKLSQQSDLILKTILNFHKYMNLVLFTFLILATVLTFTNYKRNINLELLYKAIFIFTFIVSFTVVTPLLGGKNFLEFEYFSLSVFMSTYILFLYLWLIVPFIFTDLKNINKLIKLFISVFISLNIFLTFNLKNDYMHTTSTYLSEADESSYYKEQIVDFIGTQLKSDLSIYYDLGGGVYNWIPNFNRAYYSNDYYKNSFSLGRDFDYLFKKRFKVTNNQESSFKRVYLETDFYISYNFESFPDNVYKNFKHYTFGNYRVTKNLDN